MVTYQKIGNSFFALWLYPSTFFFQEKIFGQMQAADQLFKDDSSIKGV